MKNLRAIGCLAMLLTVAPSLAYAQRQAFAGEDANLRAGPSNAYPVIARPKAWDPVLIEGCVIDYQWCDVIAGDFRGWVYSGSIVLNYQDRFVPVLTYGREVGLSTSPFSSQSYWDLHYLNRPWYQQLQKLIDRLPRTYAPGIPSAPQ